METITLYVVAELDCRYGAPTLNIWPEPYDSLEAAKEDVGIQANDIYNNVGPGYDIGWILDGQDENVWTVRDVGQENDFQFQIRRIGVSV